MKIKLTRLFIAAMALVVSPAFAVDIPYSIPNHEAKQVVAGPDRLYVLVAGNQVAMFDRTTLLPVFGFPIQPASSLIGLQEVTAIAMHIDRYLLVAGTLSDTLLNRVMFVQAYEPSRVLPGAVIVPAQLKWTWIAPFYSEARSVAGTIGFGDCVFVGGIGRRPGGTDGIANGLVVKLNFTQTAGIFHWAKYIEERSTVNAVSTHGGFSNVQVVGTLIGAGGFLTNRGFFQVFANSGGIPGPRHVWPEAGSGTLDVSPGGPGKGVYALGAVFAAVVPPDPGPATAATVILRRYSFDGTLLWTQAFVDPGPPVKRRMLAGVATDNTGVWVGMNLEYTSGPSRFYLQKVDFNKSLLYSHYVNTLGNPFLRDIDARDGSAYGVGLDAPNGFIVKTAP